MTQLNLDDIFFEYRLAKLPDRELKKAILAWGKQERIQELKWILENAKPSGTKFDIQMRLAEIEAKEDSE